MQKPHAAPHTSTVGELPIVPEGVEFDLDLARRQVLAQDFDIQGVLPLAIARPTSTEQVQRLLRWANEHRISVVPLSSTGLRRRGDTVPTRPAVVADLSAMRRLINADERDRVVIIEPGMSFGMIDALLAPYGLRSFKPLRPRAGKSVITAFLDREPITQPDAHWDVSDPLGGMEVVLGNGQMLRTGGAALPMPIEQQLAEGHRQIAAPGPAYQDYQRVIQGSQGSLAIVCWSALLVTRIPRHEKAFIIPSKSLQPLIDLTYSMLHRRLGAELFLVNGVQLALLLADVVSGPLGNSEQAFAELLERMPAWGLFVTLTADSYAPEEKMAWQMSDLSRLASEHGLTPTTQIGSLTADELHGALHRPSEQAYQDHALGAHQSLFFMQQLHRAPEFVNAVAHCLEGDTAPVSPGIYLQPMVQGSCCHMAVTLPHRPTPTETDAARSASNRAAAACADAGAFFSRPYGEWTKLAFSADKAIKPYLEMTKRIFDPGDILNPGRFF